MLVVAVPSNKFRENIISIIPYLPNQCIILSATKGLETTSNQRMTEILEDELPSTLRNTLAVLSGPNLAKEIAIGMPASTIIASNNKDVAQQTQHLFNSNTFRVYTNDDVVGVELGGSLKNIIAIGAGISDGLGYGDNSKSAFINRGLVEITRLGMALGAKPLTFSGLAGLGDLVATCYSTLSRNRYFGEEIGKGENVDHALSTMENVVEGINATFGAVSLASTLGISMPVTNSIHQILLGTMNPKEAVSALMARIPSEEWLGIEN
jgi:glycerol-3-phosphate dehydrogenase (NAD(P)+)